jgi:hypothetical protein
LSWAALSFSLLLSAAAATPTTDVGGDPSVDLSPSAQPPPSTELSLQGGLGHGVQLRSASNDFKLKVRARLQLRAAVRADDEDVDDPIQPELLVRRARIVVAGSAFDDFVEWYIQLGLSQNDVEPDNPIIVRDAAVSFNVHDRLKLRFGQMKVPFDRQRLASSSAQHFAERSTVVNELNLDRDIGAIAVVDVVDERLDFQGGVFGGDGRNRPTPTLTPLLAGRFQWTPFGSFDDLVEGDLARRERPVAALAVAGAYNVGTTRSRSTHAQVLVGGDVDYAHVNVDAVVKWRGASAMLSGITRQAIAVRGDVATRSAAGLVAQAGYFVTDGLELVVRGATMSPLGLGGDVALDPSLRHQLEGALGANLYFVGQGLKLQLDAGSIAPQGERPDFIARAQLQLFL